MSTNLLPLFLDLRGKRVLLVGGGSVARAKLAALEGTGCRLRAVAAAFSPDFLDAIRGFDATLHTRPFRASDLNGVHFAVAATQAPPSNARIADLARRRGILVNAVDDLDHCDALFASTLRRGPFVVAVSSEGAFPGLSRALRDSLEHLLPDSELEAIEHLPLLRRRLRVCCPDPADRARALRDLVFSFRRAFLDPFSDGPPDE